MKIISLWQPWASLVAEGYKRIETRSWNNSYRGPLLIHATKTEPNDVLDSWELNASLRVGSATKFVTLPRGAIIALVELLDIRPILVGSRWVADLRQEERDRGNFEPGRFGWELRPVKLFADPIPWRGAQGLLDAPDELVDMVNRTIEGE